MTLEKAMSQNPLNPHWLELSMGKIGFKQYFANMFAMTLTEAQPSNIKNKLTAVLQSLPILLQNEWNEARHLFEDPAFLHEFIELGLQATNSPHYFHVYDEFYKRNFYPVSQYYCQHWRMFKEHASLLIKVGYIHYASKRIPKMAMDGLCDFLLPEFRLDFLSQQPWYFRNCILKGLYQNKFPKLNYDPTQDKNAANEVVATLFQHWNAIRDDRDRFAATIPTDSLLQALMLGADSEYLSALMQFAARCGQQETIEVLLAAGVDPNAIPDKTKTYNGNTFNQPALVLAALNGHTEIVHLLLSYGATPPPDTLLYLAQPYSNVQETDIIPSITAVLDAGAEISVVGGHFQHTPLHVAAGQWNTRTAKLFLEWGMDPNAKDFVGSTPLHIAARNDNSTLCDILVKHGAKLDATNLDGRTPAMLAPKFLSEHLDNALALGMAANSSLRKFNEPRRHSADSGSQIANQVTQTQKNGL